MPFSGKTFWLLATFTASVLAASDASAKRIRSRTDATLDPKVIRYDIDTDSFVHQSSVLAAPPSSRRPGGSHAYAGNRLTQFQYHGKRGTGGIYDALDDYHRQLKLDPKNYAYRNHR